MLYFIVYYVIINNVSMRVLHSLQYNDRYPIHFQFKYIIKRTQIFNFYNI